MPLIKLETTVNAPIERVFDLSRSIDLHRASVNKHGEKAVAGVREGLIKLDESVTWEAMHFGIRQKLTSKITAFERPRYFRDSLVSGAFARFDHDHFFEEIKTGTLMKDVFDYDSPFWIFGKIADALFLEKYMTKILSERNRLIKETAESNDWQKYLQ